MKKLFLIIFATLNVGCAPNYALMPVDDLANKVIIKDSSFDSSVQFTAPTLNKSLRRGLLGGYDYEKYNLRGWKNKSNEKISNQLYIVIEYSGGWRFYQSASLENSSQKTLTTINRKVINCIGYCKYEEIIGVSFTNNELLDLKETGFKIRIEAKSGHENILEVPANYIQGYLNATK